MAREQVLEGIILRRWSSGESDRVVSFLTAERGKLRLRVRGTQKPNSRMSMLTEPLNRLQARIIEGRGQSLLVQPQLIRTYYRLRADLDPLASALALCETLDRWLAEDHAEPSAYHTLIQALDALEQGQDADSVVAWALWRWLALLGYAPNVGRCGACGQPVHQGDWWLQGGECLCARCVPPAKASERPLRAEHLCLLKTWLAGAECPHERVANASQLVRSALCYAESVVEVESRWLLFWERLNALREDG